MGKENIPVDKKLYNKVKKEAKETYDVWPSAYASGWLVKTYKKRFAEKHGKRKSPYKTVQKGGDLGRWFDEEWVNVCKKDKNGNYVPCGRKSARNSKKKYPYCRPLKRINENTPKTVGEMTKAEIKKMCKKKRTGDPSKKRVYVDGKKGGKGRKTRRKSRRSRRKSRKSRRKTRRTRRKTRKSQRKSARKTRRTRRKTRKSRRKTRRTRRKSRRTRRKTRKSRRKSRRTRRRKSRRTRRKSRRTRRKSRRTRRKSKK